jgi:hypothetical protein
VHERADGRVEGASRPLRPALRLGQEVEQLRVHGLGGPDRGVVHAPHRAVLAPGREDPVEPLDLPERRLRRGERGGPAGVVEVDREPGPHDHTLPAHPLWEKAVGYEPSEQTREGHSST